MTCIITHFFLDSFKDEVEEFALKLELKPSVVLEDYNEKEIIHQSDLNFDSNWLNVRCKKVVASGSPFSVQELKENVLELLKRNTEGIQEDLFNLIGFEEFEFIQELLTSREAIIKANSQKPSTAASLAPHAAKVNVKGEKLGRHFANEFSIETDSSLQALSISGKEEASYPHVYSSRRETSFSTKLALPIGTDRKDTQTYEEFIIPYNANSGTRRPAMKPVRITEMEAFARRAFDKYENLNLMQSTVYETALFSNENMLVSAPTGAGKTNVAMLAVLKAIRDQLLCDPNDPKPLVNLEGFKIVYIAPMKALATEIASKFAKRLQSFGIRVREYTGDMQLSRKEIAETQIIVSTPEKWDVITRKSHSDLELVKLVSLLIIDEVHLLHDSRGPVLESIVARTLREVEISQRMIRIVGLSATLPNYVDVAAFLRVNPYKGMFFFDDSFRPIPLTQQFIGIKGKKHGAVTQEMNRVALQKTLKFLEEGHQVMVFVHSRNETTKGAWAMIDLALEQGLKAEFAQLTDRIPQPVRQEVNKSRNKDAKELFAKGFGIHHAGMLRADRLLTEKLFMEGHIRVLFCTATLAWGVNLPAHAVIIKGTQVYDAERGEFGNLGILDVLQIFGRAGRPQFESHGEGILITGHDKLFHYLNAIMCQTPIESQFIKMLPDNLNAEIALGTVSNKQEAIAWLGYTYLHVRMRRNPLAYGLTPKEIAADPLLHGKMESIIVDVAKKLRACGMINFDSPEREGFMRCRQVGRLASLFYLRYETIEHFGACMNPRMSEEEILSMVAACSEFESIKVREEELSELEELMEAAPMTIPGDWTSPGAKVSLLIQLYISRHDPYSFSLQSDLNTMRQNIGRVMRAVFEIFRAQEWAQCALRALKLCLAAERRVWPIEHPLAQFDSVPRQVCKVLHDRGLHDLETLNDSFDVYEIARVSGQSIRIGPIIRSALLQFPRVQMSVSCQPVLPTVLALRVSFCVDFSWNERVHGHGSDKWWLWVEDESHLLMNHCELVSLTRDQVGLKRETEFYLAIDPKNPPSHLFCRFSSDRWLHAGEVYSLPLRFYSDLLLSEAGQKEAAKQHTDLLALQPLPIAALGDKALQSLYKFAFFNAIQTQCFHSLFHGSQSVLIGAPTGSGKTVLAELAMWHSLRTEPQKKIVYVAPLKALVKERLHDWRPRLLEALKLSVVELTGDYAPDQSVLAKANLILTTPEKWDNVSRNMQSKSFVNQVGLVICDEIHLLGGDRGHVLEMIVSRMRRIGTGQCRFVGLSTAMANAVDLSIWLSGSGSKTNFSCFNFRPSVRPVPLQVFLEGYADLHYCPRMASMNKPLYTHILTLSPDRPVLVFVSSRRQTRLTAQALISYCVNDDKPRRFLSEDALKEAQLASLIDRVVDPILRHTMSFGIAMHHARMPESDRLIAEEAFAAQLVQVLIATSTVAWGVNFPAHLVIVKGTEFFDAASHGYRDLPVTDILQMIGRAGRPQFDTSAKAVILAQDTKKYFYKKFLYEPFPIESSLHLHLTDHLNAEIVSGACTSEEGALNFLKTQTYLGIRVRKNPLFYGAEGREDELVDDFLKKLIKVSLEDLFDSACIAVNCQGLLTCTVFGKIAAKFYLSHRTIRHFLQMTDFVSASIDQFLRIVSFAAEFDAFPIRHNEDQEIAQFVKAQPSLIEDSFLKQVCPLDYTKPQAKVYVLLRAHCLRLQLPVLDFETDTKLAVEQVLRVLAGFGEFCAKNFKAKAFADATILSRLIKGRCWLQTELLQLPYLAGKTIGALKKEKLTRMGDFLGVDAGRLRRAGFTNPESQAILSKLSVEAGKRPISFTLSKEASTVFCLKIVSSLPRIFFVADLEADKLLSTPSRCKEIRFESDKEQVQFIAICEEFYGLDEQMTVQLK